MSVWCSLSAMITSKPNAKLNRLPKGAKKFKNRGVAHRYTKRGGATKIHELFSLKGESVAVVEYLNECKEFVAEKMWHPLLYPAIIFIHPLQSIIQCPPCDAEKFCGYCLIPFAAL